MLKDQNPIFTSDIKITEKKELERVFSHYDLKILLVEKVRSAYKVYTDKGHFCLKKIGRGHNRAKKSFCISQHLKTNGFFNTAALYPLQNGKLYYRMNKAAFYLTEWIEGRETSYNNIDDILDSTSLMARFHLCSRNFREQEGFKINNNYFTWVNTYYDNMRDIDEFVKIITKQSQTKPFDKLYLNEIQNMKKQINAALQILARPGFKTLCKEARDEGYICHDSFYYQNVLRDKDGVLFLIDLESCMKSLPVCDLGKFIRRVLSKKKYFWDFDLCRRMISRYETERPLNQEEYYVLLAFLMFPHKFWRLGIKRYKKRKKWDERKYIRKLNRIIILKDYKDEFIYNYIHFYNLQINLNPEPA